MNGIIMEQRRTRIIFFGSLNRSNFLRIFSQIHFAPPSRERIASEIRLIQDGVDRLSVVYKHSASLWINRGEQPGRRRPGPPS